MAKKKATEVAEEAASKIEPATAPSEEVTETNNEATEVAEEAAPVEVANPEPAKTEPEPVEEAKPTADASTMPAQVVDYFKRHPEVDAVYIDKLGGMFPKGTPKVFVKDAALYQNPYFKQ